VEREAIAEPGGVFSMKKCPYYKGRQPNKEHLLSCLGCKYIEWIPYEPPLCGHDEGSLHEIPYPYFAAIEQEKLE
jgi:hypothetical protein